MGLILSKPHPQKPHSGKSTPGRYAANVVQIDAHLLELSIGLAQRMKGSTCREGAHLAENGFHVVGIYSQLTLPAELLVIHL